MATVLRQSTQIKVRVGPFVDVGDGFTPETGVTLSGADEAELLKANGAATVDISGATWAAVSGSDGWYDLTLTTSHTDTVGELVVVVHDDSVCLPVYQRFQVIEEAAYDMLYAASALGYVANAPVNVAQFGGSNGTFSSGRPEVNTSHWGGSTTPVTNLNTVFNTDFATNYNTTADGWVVKLGDYAHGGTSANTTLGTLTVGGTASFAAVTTSGTVTLNALTVSGSTSLAAVSTSGTMTLNALTVTNATTLSGAVSLGSTLGVTGTTTLAALTTTGTVTFNALTVSNATTLSGAVSLGSTLGVTGTTTLAALTTTGTVTFNALTVSGATTLTGIVQAANGSNNIQVRLQDSVTHGGTAASLRLGSTSTTPAFHVTNNSGPAVKFEATGGNNDGLYLVASGSGKALDCDGGLNGTAIYATGSTGISSSGSTVTSLAVGSATISSSLSIGTLTVTTNSIAWNAAWDAEVQSECADALVAYDGIVPADLPSNFASLGINASGHVSRVTLTDTVTTYTGNTPQTGDSFARIGATGSGLTTLATQASVNTIDDFLDTEIAAILALLDDPRSEPGQGAPPVNPDLATKIDYLYKAWRNKKTQTATQYSLYADDASTVDQKATVSDDGTTTTVGEVATGP